MHIVPVLIDEVKTVLHTLKANIMDFICYKEENTAIHAQITRKEGHLS